MSKFKHFKKKKRTKTHAGAIKNADHNKWLFYLIIFPFFNPLLFFFLYFSIILICSPSPLLFPLFFFTPLPSFLPFSPSPLSAVFTLHLFFVVSSHPPFSSYPVSSLLWPHVAFLSILTSFPSLTSHPSLPPFCTILDSSSLLVFSGSLARFLSYYLLFILVFSSLSFFFFLSYYVKFIICDL